MALPGKSRSTICRALSRRRSVCIPPCTMPNKDWPGLVEASTCACAYSRQRRAHSVVRLSDSAARAWSAVYSMHSSRTMAMSEPSACWISMDFSGVRKCSEPSRCERNTAPSSVTLRSSAKLNTWKPPESVRIAPGQDMNLMQPAKPANQFMAGAQIQVIRVAQQNLHAQFAERLLRQPLHRARRAHGHERRRIDDAMRRCQPAQARAGRIGFQYLKMKIHLQEFSRPAPRCRVWRFSVA